MTRRILFLSRELPDELLRRSLEDRGFAITDEQDSEGALRELGTSRCDLFVLNLDQSADGIELIKRIRATVSLNSLLILVLGNWGTGEPALALSNGANAFEPTPIDSER